MKTYFQYLPVSVQNIDWGLYLTAVGTESVPPGCEPYPSAIHPSMYYFTWKEGRVLPEYQLLYLARGRMIFESTATRERTIDAGHVVIIFPGVWHRYRPDPATGWEKYWLSANGEDLYRLVKRRILSPAHCVFHTGLSEKIRRPYLQILRRVETHPGENPHLLAAYVMQILAETLAAVGRRARKRGEAKEKHRYPGEDDPVVGQALSHIWSHSHGAVTVDELADMMQISRRTLERRFRTVLGRSVLQTITDCRLQRAKYLLQQTKLPIDHVAMSAGFPSAAQMTNVFREYEGCTPSQCRAHLGRSRRARQLM
jgi:AraC-like DNA-binding protein